MVEPVIVDKKKVCTPLVSQLISRLATSNFRSNPRPSPPEYSPTMDDELPAARLQLTIFSAQGLKDVRLLGRTRTSVLAWVDPARKQATTDHRASTRNPIWNQTLTIPLSASALADPSSIITLQLLCRRAASTAGFRLCVVRNDGRVFTLPLERPPGRCRGFVTVSAHIFLNGCVAGIPVESGSKVERLPWVPIPPQLLKGFFVGLVSGAAGFFLASRVARPLS